MIILLNSLLEVDKITKTRLTDAGATEGHQKPTLFVIILIFDGQSTN